MRTKISATVLFLLYFPSGVFAQSNNAAQTRWMPKEITPIKKELQGGLVVSVGSTILFSSGIRLTSDLVRPKYLGQLRNGKANPFYIFQANTCDACDETPMIRIVSQSGDTLKDATNEPLPFPPGRLFAFGPEKKLLSQSRLFYGDCLKDHKQVAVWFIHTMQSGSTWTDSVFIVENSNGKLKSTSLSSALPSIKETIDRLNNGQCNEVPGSDIEEGP